MTFWPGVWSETTLEQHPVHEHTLHELPALAYKSEMKVNRSPAWILHSRPLQAVSGSPMQATAMSGLAAQAATSTGIDVSLLQIH